MGGTNSKGGERTEALRLCRERKRFIKQAIDSRYALAAAHVAYVESLRKIGVALRRYAVAEILIESSISTSATELDKTPSHSSYHPSPSPSHIGGVSDSPVLNGSSPLSPSMARMSYMVAGGTAAVTVRVRPKTIRHKSMQMDMDDCEFPTLPPPPEPPRGSGSSWDFFDPVDDSESFRFVGQNNLDMNIGDEKIHAKNGKNVVVDFDGDNEIDEVFITPKCEARSNSKLVVRDGGGNSIGSQKSG